MKFLLSAVVVAAPAASGAIVAGFVRGVGMEGTRKDIDCLGQLPPAPRCRVSQSSHGAGRTTRHQM